MPRSARLIALGALLAAPFVAVPACRDVTAGPDASAEVRAALARVDGAGASLASSTAAGRVAPEVRSVAPDGRVASADAPMPARAAAPAAPAAERRVRGSATADGWGSSVAERPAVVSADAPAPVTADAPAPPATGGPVAAAGRVGLDAVLSIDVTLTGVQVHANASSTAPGHGAGGWFDLALTAADPGVDLVNLSSTAVVVASGDLTPGQEIDRVRLFVADPTITFDTDIRFPPAGPQSEVVCEKEVPCPLRIPSADDTGVKVDVDDFVVGADETVTIRFDAGTSVKNIVINAHGAQMTPVVSAGGG